MQNRRDLQQQPLSLSETVLFFHRVKQKHRHLGQRFNVR